MQGYVGQSFAKLQNLKFKEWGKELELILTKDLHFDKTIGKWQKGTEYLSHHINYMVHQILMNLKQYRYNTEGVQ